jgi:hypothetical protein
LLLPNAGRPLLLPLLLPPARVNAALLLVPLVVLLPPPAATPLLTALASEECDAGCLPAPLPPARFMACSKPMKNAWRAC